MSYDKLKIFISEHRAQLVTTMACAVMFVVGFGTGQSVNRHDDKTNESQHQDYTANQAAKPEEVGENATLPQADDKKVTPEANSTAKPAASGKPYDPNQPCVIKGNISGSSKIYHIKGGASYDKTVPEQCFNTEAEAQAAGFRKAKRWCALDIHFIKPKTFDPRSFEAYY